MPSYLLVKKVSSVLPLALAYAKEILKREK